MDKETQNVISLLRSLIAIPSFSWEEKRATDFLQLEMEKFGVVNRIKNNLWMTSKNYSENKPDLLLVSHLDTVRPSLNYSFNPFLPLEIDGKIMGLGANDAGAALMTLWQCFLNYRDEKQLAFNLIFAAVAEEEISGQDGIELLLTQIQPDIAIVGEPTQNQPAIAEKGLLVIDARITGESAHVANGNGINAITESLHDLQLIRHYRPDKISDLLGETKITITSFHSGKQHNVIPDLAEYVLDIRLTEVYSHEMILSELQSKLKA